MGQGFLSRLQGVGALVFVIILGLIFNSSGSFYHWNTHRDMLRQVSVYGLLATGMTFVVITGGIDLSVGSILGFVAVIFSLLTLHLGFSAFSALVISLLVGTACGVVSGLVIVRFKMQPFIATLAMMVFARGMAKWFSGGQKISTTLQAADGTFSNVPLPPVFLHLDQRMFGGNISVVTLIFFASLLISGLFLSYFKFGRYLYATGGSEHVSFLSGLPVNKVKVFVYAFSGLLSAIAGICQAAQEQQGDPEAGTSYELMAIAIVVIGGTSLNGGKGSIFLTFIGALTIGYLDKILSINAVGEPTRLMLTGLIILVAVVLQDRDVFNFQMIEKLFRGELWTKRQQKESLPRS